VLVDGRLLDALGGLDEDFFLYYEEVALCRSARRAGWRVEYDPTVEVVHLRPLQNRALSPRLRMITRHSKLLYFQKHLPRWQFFGLCMVVHLEARVLGAWSLVRRRREDVRAWRAIARVVQALRAGTRVTGRDVLAYADEIPGARPESLRGPSTRRSEPSRLGE
jgi:GT2 family glycosyltransferase